MKAECVWVVTALSLACTAPIGAIADTLSPDGLGPQIAPETTALVSRASSNRRATASYPTRTCVTINDFSIPSALDLATLRAYKISCVRFDLGAANAKEVAASRAEVRAVAADGLGILLITPYIPLNAPISHALFVADAEITEQTIALAPSAFVGVELMNEANEEAPLAETQLKPSEYVDYANTVAAAMPSWMYVITSGLSVAEPSWQAWDAQTVPYIARANCVGTHLYGVNPTGFGSALAAVRSAFNKPVCMTEWAPQSGATLAAAFRSSAADYAFAGNHAPLFGLFNLRLLEANSWEAALRR
jgi:hypothetical protein